MTKRKWVIVAACVVMAVVLIAVYYAVAPAETAWMPRCPMKALTGLSCPGCGMQRALHAALHGRLGEAISYNYLLPAALVLIVLLVASPRESKLRLALISRWACIAYLAVMIGWMVARNILGI